MSYDISVYHHSCTNLRVWGLVDINFSGGISLYLFRILSVHNASKFSCTQSPESSIFITPTRFINETNRKAGKLIDIHLRKMLKILGKKFISQPH